MRLSEGNCFGELALLNNALRSATVVATSDCFILCLDRGVFKLILSSEKKKIAFFERFSQIALFK